jgi:hypothetical protein
MPNEKLPDDVLWHQSGVNAKGEPFVQLIRGHKIVAQMDPEQARDHGRVIIEAAEAAEQDAFLFGWAQKIVGVGQVQAMGLLQEFRQYRRERTGKNSGARNERDWVMPEPKDEPGTDPGAKARKG